MKTPNFYTIAIAVMRENKFCKHEPGRHCAIIESDEKCQECVKAKDKAMRAIK